MTASARIKFGALERFVYSLRIDSSSAAIRQLLGNATGAAMRCDINTSI
jgi:hypothetical protein